jgi:hypothetical protein
LRFNELLAVVACLQRLSALQLHLALAEETLGNSSMQPQ